MFIKISISLEMLCPEDPLLIPCLHDIYVFYVRISRGVLPLGLLCLEDLQVINIRKHFKSFCVLDTSRILRQTSALLNIEICHCIEEVFSVWKIFNSSMFNL